MAVNYTYFTLSDPLSSSGTRASGINDAGQIVGYYTDSNFDDHGFLYHGTTYITLDDPLGIGTTQAYGINNSGQIVGSYLDSNFNLHAFIYSGGTYTTLDAPLGSLGTSANAINNAGQIVGYFANDIGYNGFLFSAGTFTTLNNPLGTNGTIANGINAAGQIVGQYFDSSNTTHGFIYSAGIFTTLDNPLGAGGTSATAINDAGQVVGIYVDGFGVNHGFLYSGGSFATIDDPLGAGGTFVSSINSTGQIVGDHQSSSLLSQGLLGITDFWLTATTDTGTPYVSAGHVVTITLMTGAAVTVSGTPTLQLNDNEVATYTSGSGTHTLTFSYVVQPGDHTSQLKVTGLNLPGGANIQGMDLSHLPTPGTGDLGIVVGSVAAVTSEQIQTDTLTILRVPDSDADASAVATRINSGQLLLTDYLHELANEAKDTTSAILSIFEIMGTKLDSASLDNETLLIASINAAFNPAAGWVAIGASLADSHFSLEFAQAYKNLSIDDFINTVTQEAFGTVINTPALHHELAIYTDFFAHYPVVTDPTGEIRARGGFISDMLHQASDFAALHPESPVGRYEHASEMFLVGLVNGSTHYGDSIFT